MPAEKHPSYREELERCNYTLDYVEKTLKSSTEKKERLDRDIERLRRHLSSEASQDYIDLLVNTTIQGSLELRLRNLITARSKPYFARIDFREKGSGKKEKLYIGKMSLMREEDQEIIIVDWRAPIANLYYEGRLGEASYESPGGKVEGELGLKRQFSINNGILQEIFDIDITTNDEFLQSYLGAAADSRLKEIVSTIQVEQNRIIRADMWSPLIVQGAAGSGKTTIALHRIAYLIYNYEKTFTPENFMIIAPTRFFLNYISEVLPELGVEKVRQTTFEDFALELLGKKLKVRDANEKLVTFVNRSDTPEEKKRNELLAKSSEFKSSMLFKEVLDSYIEKVEIAFIPPEDFKIGSRVIYSYKEIQALFLNEYKRLPIVQRINEIKKHLTNRLKLQKSAIINQFHDESDKKIKFYKAAMPETEERRQLISDAIDSRNLAIDKVESISKKAVKDYISRISKVGPFDYYKELISDKAAFDTAGAGKADPGLLDFTRSYTFETLKSGVIDIEDIAPIIYLKYCIHGMDEKVPVRHIVIDEAQDFSVFQFYVLKKIVKDSSYTILGDICQGIHSYRGISDWKDVMESVFPERKSQFLTLEQSYRTTVEILTAANKVLEKAPGREYPKGTPVIRHGEPVKVVSTQNLKESAANIAEKINSLKLEFKSMAVICKTAGECRELLSALKKSVPEIYILNGKDDVYKSGIAIVPSYLAKGLEFDIVFIADASVGKYGFTDLDAKLLYVAMTRPLHKLFIYSPGELSPLLAGI